MKTLLLLTMLLGFAFAQDSQPEPINEDKVLAELKKPAKAAKGGMVAAKLKIDKTGKVVEVQILSSPDEALIEPTQKAAEKLRYKPALVDGKPVDFWIMIPFNFR